MKKDKTLLIMAAGMGSRFGGLKQIEPIGPNGEFLIDYSIYDAIREGFNKVVFVIKKENESVFKETIGSRVPNDMKVEYAFQCMEDLPKGYSIPTDTTGPRVKPWGTAHAIRAARQYINEPFVIINADDFYGRDAYRVASEFLDKRTDENCYSVVGYQVKNTLSENGAVKRGVCLEKNHELTELIESTIEKKDGVIVAKPLDESKKIMKLDENSLVSMNMLCFEPSIFNYIETRFTKFLDKNLETNPMKSEFLIPDVLDEAKREKIAKVILESTSASWYGVTYREDKNCVISAIASMIDSGLYPYDLWEKSNVK